MFKIKDIENVIKCKIVSDTITIDTWTVFTIPLGRLTQMGYEKCAMEENKERKGVMWSLAPTSTI